MGGSGSSPSGDGEWRGQRLLGVTVLMGRDGSVAGVMDSRSGSGLPEQGHVGKCLGPVVCPRMGSRRWFCFLCLDEADVGSEGLPELWLLLTFCLFVPVAIGLVLVALRRSGPRRCLATEELDEDK